ncbi:MAG TPA: ferric reductase-like transmembrane domain-containing protein [Acidimicrobiales bacterium]|jgi:DMSO/TMAO reductase YedYZ heme-binding membrane subunit|nr:ferric reductase-like transmembrane domain-containing protein [Acidimicrobiales bacterium]
MTPTLVATVGHGSTALWYLTRASGLVSLVLLSGTVVLGIVASVGWTTERWPRFLSQSVHRNLSLLCLVLIAVHVVTTVADGYVPIGYLDAVIPFRTPYRPIWVGFGALAFDMLLAVAITSGLRRRIGTRAWRGVHWLAYLCWPVALLHGLGAGSDTRLSVTLVVDALCVLAVAGAGGWRLVTGRSFPAARRILAALLAGTTLVGIGVVAVLGPLASGWSKRAGTSPALLAQLNAAFTSGGASGGTSGASGGTGGASGGTSSTAALPATPFTSAAQGTYQTSSANTAGQVTVTLTLQPTSASTAPLVVKLNGSAANGGVAMTSSQVTWGPDSGVVTALSGASIGARLNGPAGSIHVALQLSLDQAHGTVTGTMAVTKATTGGSGA